MKCARCGGLMLKSTDGVSCVNCGHEVKIEERVFVRAVSSLEPQKLNLRISLAR